MSAAALLKRCRSSGIELSAHGDRLHIKAAGAVDADTKAALVRFKAELLEILTPAAPEAARAEEAPTLDELKRAAIETLPALREITNRPDSGAGVEVVAYTPMGVPLRILAANAAHAAWIQRMNPKPAQPLKAVPVRCADCGHAMPTSHAGLIDCRAEMPAPGSCGPFRWWADDSHNCQTFTPATEDGNHA
jgi:hypothetical protein